MDSQEVAALLDEICFMFNRAQIKNEAQLGYFARMLRSVNPAAAPFISAQFRQLESFPGNLLHAINQAYSAWLATRPKSVVNCEHCHGTGWLHYRRYSVKYFDQVEYFGRCPRCAYWRGCPGVALLTEDLLPIAKASDTPFH